MRNVDLTAEELARVVSQAGSITELLSLLGLNNSGGRRAALKRKIAELGLDASHFGRSSYSKYTPEILSAAVAASTLPFLTR
jgi:hypothetical protein